jgi:hypothetical protein
MRKSYDDYSFLPVDALSQKKKKKNPWSKEEELKQGMMVLLN